MKSTLNHTVIGSAKFGFVRLASLAVALFVGAGALSYASAEVEMNMPEGNYQKQLGNGKIADPSGVNHTKATVAGKVMVAIFSIPNMSQGDIQEKWAKLLAEDPKTKVSDHVFLLLVEDMSQAGWTSGMARSSIKKEFTPKSRPFLVMDETGDFTKRFGVPEKSTRILIYDKTGKLRDVETDLDNDEKTSERIKAITKKLMAE